MEVTVCVCARAHESVYVCACACSFVLVCVCACMHVCVCVCVLVCVSYCLRMGVCVCVCLIFTAWTLTMIIWYTSSLFYKITSYFSTLTSISHSHTLCYVMKLILYSDELLNLAVNINTNIKYRYDWIGNRIWFSYGKNSLFNGMKNCLWNDSLRFAAGLLVFVLSYCHEATASGYFETVLWY